MASSVKIVVSLKDSGGAVAQLDGATKQEYLARVMNLLHSVQAGNEACAVDVACDSVTEVAAALTFSVAQASCTAGDKIGFVIPGGPTIVLTAGTEDTAAGTYSILTSNTVVAASIASCINNYPLAYRHFTATSSVGNVTVTVREKGSWGNSIKATKNVTTAAAVVYASDSALKSTSFLLGKDASDRPSMTISCTQASLVAGQTIRIGSVSLAWASSASGENQVTIGASDTAAGTNLAAAINAHSVLKQMLVATSALGVVTCTYWCAGRVGETLRVFTEGTAASSTVTYTGTPVADETLTVANVVLTFKASSAASDQITISANNTTQATNTVTIINAHATLSKLVLASSSAGVVTITALHKGLIGNVIPLAESATGTAVGAALLAGGLEAAGMSLSGAAPDSTAASVYLSDARNFTFGMGTTG